MILQKMEKTFNFFTKRTTEVQSSLKFNQISMVLALKGKNSDYSFWELTCLSKILGDL